MVDRDRAVPGKISGIDGRNAARIIGRSWMTYTFAAGLFGVVTLATAALATASAPGPVGNAVKGKAVFGRCAMCHKIDKAVPGGIGPNLAGVYRRAAGQVPGYSYSPAMKASRLRWDEATLSRFIAAPTKVVPGTKMMAPPVANAQDRADIIAYLAMTSGAKK
jgi:cytochrome c